MSKTNSLISTILSSDTNLRSSSREVMKRMGYSEDEITDAEMDEHTEVCTIVNGTWECHDEHPERDQLQDIAGILKIGFEVSDHPADSYEKGFSEALTWIAEIESWQLSGRKSPRPERPKFSKAKDS